MINFHARLPVFVASTAFGLVFSGIAVSAGPFDGIYKQTANAECALVGVDGGSVEVRDDIFYGVEVECRMSNPVNVVDMDALLYTMQCSGAGQQFSERAMLMKTADDTGLIMVWNGYAFVYEACANPDQIERIAPESTIAPSSEPDSN